MPLSLRRGVVTAVVEREEALARIEVDGTPCVAYPLLTGPVALGDEVVVNVQGRELGLGSGGFDVLYVNLTRGLGLSAAPGAHVMKLPYTPVQFAARHAEEDGPLAELAEGLPVVACSLHSQVVPVCAALSGVRVAYVQLPGGALPVPLSDSLRALRRRGLVEQAISVGACFGGDVECVSIYSALAHVEAQGFDAAVCAIGPGIVGTGTAFGHGGMAAAIALSAAAELRAQPILALRLSEADPRPRHRGLSHHAAGILALRGPAIRKAWPEGCPIDDCVAEGADVVDAGDWREACAGLPLSHMGRGPEDDPWFFAAAFAAGRLACRLVR
jgi:Protein of unknown function (DUF3866)